MIAELLNGDLPDRVVTTAMQKETSTILDLLFIAFQTCLPNLGSSIHSSQLEATSAVAGRAEIDSVQLLPERQRQQGRQAQKRPVLSNIRRDWKFQIPSSLRRHQDNFPNRKLLRASRARRKI